MKNIKISLINKEGYCSVHREVPDMLFEYLDEIARELAIEGNNDAPIMVVTEVNYKEDQ